MNFSNYARIEIPEGRVKSIKRKSDGLELWKAGYINMVPLSTESDGVTIYNGGLGYKDGYRVRSGGAEIAYHEDCFCTGFIPVTAGDIIRITGVPFFSLVSVASAINVSDSTFTNIGQFTSQISNYGIFLSTAYAPYGGSSVVEEKEGVWKWIVPPAGSGVAYIRLSGDTSYTLTTGADAILTINEEITD